MKPLHPFYISPFHRVLRLANASPDVVLALGFLFAWFSPQIHGFRSVKHYLLVMLLEFLVIHSAALMESVSRTAGERGNKAAKIIGLGMFYSLFSGGFSLAFQTWWPFLAFWALTLNRLAALVVGRIAGQEPQSRQAVSPHWVLSVLLYLGGVFLTLFLPMPRFGLTPEVVTNLGLPGTGAWVEEPHRVIAFGFFYFAAQAVFEVRGAPRALRGARR